MIQCSIKLRMLTLFPYRQRKTLTHQQLVLETLSVLSAQFKPDVNMIKQRIEALIDREYLERIDDSDPPAYRYLA